jgi:c-di-GMP-related signal transduction protein
MLSLVDRLLDQPIARALADLNVDEGIRRAIEDHAGPLGRQLRLVEALEALDADRTRALADELRVSAEALRQAQAEAFRWARSLESEAHAA